MAFTPGFENDIFISYCHDDNDAPRDESGWVDHFHERLESSLVQRFGRKQITIWRDKELQGSTLFDQRIQERIAKSALFLALISPNYLRSDYCRKELAWFFDEAQKSTYGLSVNHEYRILPVFLRNIGHTAWPKELKGITGFPMHDQEENSEKRGAALDHREVLYTKKLRFIVDMVETILPLFPGNGAGLGEDTGETKDDEAEKRQQEEQERLQKEKASLLAKEAEEEQRRQEEQERLLKEKGKLLEKQAGAQKKVKRLALWVAVLSVLAAIMTAGLVYVLMNPTQAVKSEEAKSNILEKQNQKSNTKPETLAAINQASKTKPMTENKQPQSTDKKPETSDQTKQTFEPKPKTLEKKPQTSNSKAGTLADNYERAREFDEKAMTALASGQGTNDPARFRDAWLYMAAALRQEIDGQLLPLRPASAAALLNTAVIDAALGKRWVSSPAIFQSNIVTCVAFSPDGRTIASGSDSNTIRLWDKDTGKEIACLTGHTHTVSSVAFSPDGRTIASGSFDKTIRLWNWKSKNEIAILMGHSSYVYTVTFSPDGQTLASGSDDQTIRLWDWKSKKKIAVLTGHKDTVYCVAFSPDSRTIVSGSKDQTIRLWERNSKQDIAALTGHTDYVLGVVFSPDGQIIASGSTDKTIRLWNWKSKKEIAILTGHTKAVGSITFSPDGRTIASGSGDQTIRLWDRQTKKAIACLTGHSNWVNGVVFSPDGRTIGSTSDDKNIRLWDVRLFDKFLKGGKPTPLFFTFAAGAEFFWGYRVEGFEIKYVGRPANPDKKFLPLLDKPAPGKTKFEQILSWAQAQEKKE